MKVIMVFLFILLIPIYGCSFSESTFPKEVSLSISNVLVTDTVHDPTIIFIVEIYGGDGKRKVFWNTNFHNDGESLQKGGLFLSNSNLATQVLLKSTLENSYFSIKQRTKQAVLYLYKKEVLDSLDTNGFRQVSSFYRSQYGNIWIRHFLDSVRLSYFGSHVASEQRPKLPYGWEAVVGNIPVKRKDLRIFYFDSLTAEEAHKLADSLTLSKSSEFNL